MIGRAGDDDAILTDPMMEADDGSMDTDLTGYRGRVKIQEWARDEGGRKWAKEKYGKDWKKMTIITEVKGRGENENKWVITFPENDSEPDGEMTGKRISTLLSPRRGAQKKTKTPKRKSRNDKTSSTKTGTPLATSSSRRKAQHIEPEHKHENLDLNTPAKRSRKKRSRSTPSRTAPSRPATKSITEQAHTPTLTPTKPTEKKTKISTSTESTPLARHRPDKETQEPTENRDMVRKGMRGEKGRARRGGRGGGRGRGNRGGRGRGGRGRQQEGTNPGGEDETGEGTRGKGSNGNEGGRGRGRNREDVENRPSTDEGTHTDETDNQDQETRGRQQEQQRQEQRDQQRQQQNHGGQPTQPEVTGGGSQETEEEYRQEEQDEMDEEEEIEGAEALLAAILAVRDFINIDLDDVGMEEHAAGGGYAWIQIAGEKQNRLEIRDLEALEFIVGQEMAKKKSEGSMGKNQSIEDWYEEREKEQRLELREYIVMLELDLYKQARQIEKLTGAITDKESKRETLQRKDAHTQEAAAAQHTQARITVADNVLGRLEALESKLTAIQMRGSRDGAGRTTTGETGGPSTQTTRQKDRDEGKHDNREQGERKKKGWGPTNYTTLNSTAHTPYTRTQHAWGVGRLICNPGRADQHTPPTFEQPHPRLTTHRQHTVHATSTSSHHTQRRVRTGDRANPTREVAIRGIPYRVKEDLRGIVRSIVHEAGLEPLDERDYDCIRALGKGKTREDQESNTITPRIIVTLATQKLKDALRRRPRQPLLVRHTNIQGLDEHTNSRQIFINENLTRDQGHLFYKARQRRGIMGWPYAWTANGAVLVRRREGWEAEEIHSVADLDRLELEEVEYGPPGDHPTLPSANSRRSSASNMNLNVHSSRRKD